MNSVFWNPSETPAELHSILETLADGYPIKKGKGELKLNFKKSTKSGVLKVKLTEDSAFIEYAFPAAAARAITFVFAGLEVEEKGAFKTFGIMLDCSRNAVMKVEHLKKWLRSIAMMGYNMAMLYTEDTYKLPEEAYFGYMRGAYTMDEIKEIDEYAARLGIELIPCIQTLGHLEKVLRWGAYYDVKDTSSVLLVDEEKTYKLTSKMLDFWSEACRSRRIHIGMDETHDLGRGRFTDTKGYERGFDIFNRHLAKLTKLCKDKGLKPMIWSDMYFRMGNPTYNYYDKATVIPEDVKKAIPKGTELVYWDYYHEDYDFYVEWIKRHRELGKEPLMGSGAWTWVRWWYDAHKTEATVRPCVKACRDMKLGEFFVTLWGDDGAYCDFDSVLAGLCWISELAYGNEGDDKKRLEKLFKAVTGSSYAAHMIASDIQCSNGYNHNMLYDDPLMNKFFAEINITNPGGIADLRKTLESVVKGLKKYSSVKGAGDFAHASNIASVMLGKIDMHAALSKAYLKKNKKALKALAETEIPALIKAYKKLAESFRKQWMEHNKPFGLETMQIRFAGQIARLQETSLRIKEYLDGRVDSIPELDEELKASVPEVNLHGHYPKYAQS